MLFERFCSRERNEPPDIDVDFEHERREEVFQYIYDKYGRERAGIVAEVITYRSRSAVRDVGKALGLSLDRVDAMAKSLEWWGDESLLEERLRQAGVDPTESTIRALIGLFRQIVGFPRHLSQHVGGFVITQSPLCEMVPLENGAMPDRTFIEWDKDDIDALGILKVDCLALGMLTAIHKCFEMVNDSVLGSEKLEVRSQKEYEITHDGGGYFLTSHFSLLTSPYPLALHTIPAEDQVVYDMICAADTIGVFQIESRAQMSMLPRLRPRCYYDLVIEVAIVRPGPIQGQMVHPYLRRRNGQERVTYPTPEIESVLKKTLGVPLFQEQAMQLAVVAAGFTPGEADQLRRSMGAWRRRGVMEKFRHRLIEGMRQRGLSEEFAQRVFEQIRGFGAYGFPESHAASFALLVYVSCWLKRYHPAAYCVAVINSQPMGFYAPAQLVRDAREHGVEIRPVDVNYSSYDCTLERADPCLANASRRESGPPPAAGLESWGADGPAVRLGLRLVKGISRAKVEGIERSQQDGPFTSVADLHRRCGASRATLARLAAADAFRSMGLDRRQALWQILAIEDDEPPLFAGLEATEPPPALPVQSLPQRVAQDYDTTGMSLTAHPMSLLRKGLESMGIIHAGQLRQTRTGQRVRIAGLVLVRQRPSTAKGILFYTLEDETGIANLIVRPGVYARYRRAARGAVALLAEGRVERQGEVIHVQTVRLSDLSEHLDRLPSCSRDFH
jgi:error-prone DNA polymerase